MNIPQRNMKSPIYKLITSRYPPINIFENAKSPEDAKAALLLETLTSGRLNPQLERLNKLPKTEIVTGSGSGYIMAAFLYGKPGRFNNHTIGAYYASFDLQTAIKETIYHHIKRLKKEENGLANTTIRMRQLAANVNNEFYDIATKQEIYEEIYDLNNYEKSQNLANKLKENNANGIYYRSVRHKEGKNIVIFKPSLIKNLKQLDHFEYEWRGSEEPNIMKLTNVEL